MRSQYMLFSKIMDLLQLHFTWFYLSWFGALILIAIIHTTLKTIPAGCVNLKNYQLFFGRYMVFFFVGQVQTLITVLGPLLFVGIQCEHPFMYWMAAAISSFTFTLFMYSLSYALEMLERQQQ